MKYSDSHLIGRDDVKTYLFIAKNYYYYNLTTQNFPICPLKQIDQIRLHNRLTYLIIIQCTSNRI